MSAQTEYLRGQLEEKAGAMVRRPRASFTARGNDVWAERSGRVFAPGEEAGMSGGSAEAAWDATRDLPRWTPVPEARKPDYSSPVTGNGMGNISRLVGGKRRTGGTKHTQKTSLSQGRTQAAVDADRRRTMANLEHPMEKMNMGSMAKVRGGVKHTQKQSLTQGRTQASVDAAKKVSDASAAAYEDRMKHLNMGTTYAQQRAQAIQSDDSIAGRFLRGITTLQDIAAPVVWGIPGAAINAMVQSRNPNSMFYIPDDKRTAGNVLASGALAGATAGVAGAVGEVAGTAAEELGAYISGTARGIGSTAGAAGAHEIGAVAGAPAPSTWYAPPANASAPGYYQPLNPSAAEFFPGVGKGRRVKGGAQLTPPALRGAMDPTGVGRVYNVMYSPDMETQRLMTEGQQAYTGGAKPKKLTAAEKQALDVYEEAKAMGMSLEQHLKHNKIPAAKRRTMAKRVANAVAKGHKAVAAVPTPRKNTSRATGATRGHVISDLMKSEGMTLGEASRYIKNHPEVLG